MCKAFKHDNSTLKYVIKLAFPNLMCVDGRNWRDHVNWSQYISVIGMNVKHMNSEWYDMVSDNEIDIVCIFKRNDWGKGWKGYM